MHWQNWIQSLYWSCGRFGSCGGADNGSQDTAVDDELSLPGRKVSVIARGQGYGTNVELTSANACHFFLV